MDSFLDRFRPRPVTVFSLLTLVIWTNRIWLAWTNPDDSVAEKVGWSTPITIFWLSAAGLLVLQAQRKADTTRFTRWVQVFAVGTVAYWAIRVAVIFGGDWDLPFKVVHTVLAVVSAVAAIVAFRSVGSSAQPASTVGSPSPANTASSTSSR